MFNLSDVFTKEEVRLTSKREELLLLSVVPSLAVEVDRSKIIKRLQQTFSLYINQHTRALQLTPCGSHSFPIPTLEAFLLTTDKRADGLPSRSQGLSNP